MINWCFSAGGNDDVGLSVRLYRQYGLSNVYVWQFQETSACMNPCDDGNKPHSSHNSLHWMSTAGYSMYRSRFKSIRMPFGFRDKWPLLHRLTGSEMNRMSQSYGGKYQAPYYTVYYCTLTLLAEQWNAVKLSDWLMTLACALFHSQ